MTFTLFITLAAFLISLIGTRLLILAFRDRRMLIDVPNARSNHTTPVPRGGGLAVVFAMIIPMMVADIPLYVVLSILLLAAVSLLDDLISVPALVRLLVQIIAVSIPLSSMDINILGDVLPPLAEKMMVGIAWIWFINLFNFMDGVDGLSATEMISVGLAIALLIIFAGIFPDPVAEYGMIVAAAGAGFWWWNKHPAKIFLGDVGSIPIGFMLGYLLVYIGTNGFLAAAIIIPAYYVTDTSVTLFKRIIRKQKIWEAHSEHYYQRAVRKGWSHQSVNVYIAGINILTGYIAIQSMLYPDLNMIFIALAYMAVCMLLGFFGYEQAPQV